ncbi:MAG TPA: hypothetical protein VN081_05040 [Dongiaceae bacterium]|nr:hypothetical protein [Dongiaceae bacterium]
MSDPITVAGAAGTALSALQVVKDFKDRAAMVAANVDAAGGAADSLVSYTKPARAEPITLVDKTAVNLPYTKDVLLALTSLYAGYYLQAVALMVGVGRINVIKILDQLNPERSGEKNVGSYLLEKSLSELAESSHLFSKESYQYGLPAVKKSAFGLEAYREGLRGDMRLNGELTVAMEAVVYNDPKDRPENQKPEFNIKKSPAYRKDKDGKEIPIDTTREAKFGKSIEDIADVPNLAVGKMLEVNIEDNGAKATFPVAVRLIVSSIDPDTLVHILGDGVKDSSTEERWHAWRSGAISLADMIFAIDAIDAHRSTLMKDKSGSYAEIMRRRRNNGLTTLRSGIAESTTKTSIGTASNIVVMTEETVKKLERQANIRFSNAAQRKQVFDMSYLMFIAVIDTEWEHVTFYTRGIALPTELTVKQIQNSAKGSGPDVAEILKAYKLGNSPSL